MIYLHCGWPKTGTSSLQAVLLEHRDRLADAGVVYPDRWRVDGESSHHGLLRQLEASLGSAADISVLAEALVKHADEDLLVSCESIAIWLLRDERSDALGALLTAVAQRTSLTCIWTLRRFDEMAHSGCLHAALAGTLPDRPEKVMSSLRHDRMLSNMRKLDDMVDGRSVYLEYDPAGTHNIELIRVLGLPDETAKVLCQGLNDSPRLNVGVSHKQLAAVLNAKELSAKLGVHFDRRSLLESFRRGELRFADDRPCELAGRDLRRDVHFRALETAQKCGLAPYLRFFEDDRLDDVPTRMSLDAFALDDDDLGRLTAHMSTLAALSSVEEVTV